MPEIGQTAPTRTVLLQLRQRLAEARRAYDILERKREVLLRELWGLYREVQQRRPQVQDSFRAAYQAQRTARLLMGTEHLRWAGLTPASRTVYTAGVRQVMGVALPRVNLEIQPLPLPYSPAGISTTFDELRERWINVGKILGPWLEALGALSRITKDLEKTQRRANALKNLLIPRYETTIEQIRAVLEEQERDTFIRIKRVKQSRKEP